MKSLFCFIALAFLASCGRQFRFKEEAGKADSSYVYALPFPEGKKKFLLQGYNSSFSHKGRVALDFPMRLGSPVTAARPGIVTRVEQGFSKGGVNKKYLRKANQVIIRHNDGSMAYYGHLRHNGVVVAVGDTVKEGQILAYSGSTGYSALPHLHFIVWGPTPTGRDQLPTRFKTQNGIQYLRPGHWYRHIR